jgi:hypothetical protein
VGDKRVNKGKKVNAPLREAPRESARTQGKSRRSA